MSMQSKYWKYWPNFLKIAHLFKEFGITSSLSIICLFCLNVIFFLSWIEIMYKNYKINCKIFNPLMEKVAILLWHIWIYRNEIVVKKIQPNPFLVIKKATLNFQSLQDFVTEWCNVPWVVEKLIRWIPLINGIFQG